MLAEIATAFGIVKTATESIQILDKAIENNAVSTVKADLFRQLLEVQAALISANEAMAALQGENRAIKEELVRIENFEQDAKRYSLREIRRGALVYALKPDVGDPETPHWLCVRCFGDHRKSFLQLDGSADLGGGFGVAAKWACPACQSAIFVGRGDCPA